MGTLVYLNGGMGIMHELKGRSLMEWKKYGRKNGMNHLYKGYRYYGGVKDIVCVFDTVNWSKVEIARRKKNGFLGIKKYAL